MLQKLKKAQAGFTIIELLIVIAIIAILAGLVLNNFQGAQAKARDTQRVTDVNNLHTKLEEFYNDNNGYPNTFTADTFPGIDGESLNDPKGNPIDINDVVADEAAALAVDAPDGSGSTDQYQYVPFGTTGCLTDCTGYVLRTYVEKPTATTTNPYVKLGLNNP